MEFNENNSVCICVQASIHKILSMDNERKVLVEYPGLAYAEEDSIKKLAQFSDYRVFV